MSELSPLNAQDYGNLVALLERVQVNGLREAEALVVLAVKLRDAASPDLSAAKHSEA